MVVWQYYCVTNKEKLIEFISWENMLNNYMQKYSNHVKVIVENFHLVGDKFKYVYIDSFLMTFIIQSFKSIDKVHELFT